MIGLTRRQATGTVMTRQQARRDVLWKVRRKSGTGSVGGSGGEIRENLAVHQRKTEIRHRLEASQMGAEGTEGDWEVELERN